MSMKKACLLLPILLIKVLCTAQTQAREYPLVQVTDWKSRGYLFSDIDDFLSTSQDTIIRNIGIEEFKKIKQFCNIQAWPEALRPRTDFYKDTAARRVFFEKMDKLKMYKIASCQNLSHGRDHGRCVILRVPYKSNESWDLNAKWDTVYFILDEKSVKVLR